MSLLSVPTTSALPSTQLVPSSHPIVHRILNRLSRPSLLSLVLDWLDERNQENIEPYLVAREDEDEDDIDQDLYPPARSLASLREIYTELQARKGSKRDIVDRIIEGDWRDGISLYQLAMADVQYLFDHPLSQKWTALKVVRLSEDTSSSKPSSIPRFHPSTFLRNLQKEVLPDVKAHYNLSRHVTLPITILRIFVVESPYNTATALHDHKKSSFDSSKTFYVVFPDASPYIYVSLLPPSTAPGVPSSKSENRSLRNSILEGIPKAFSKPRERYKLQSTNLSAKNLEALLERRGQDGTNSAGGAWKDYAEEKKDGRENPLNNRLPTPEASVEVADTTRPGNVGLKRVREEDERVVKRRKMIARGRFGNSGKLNDGQGIERLDIKIEDPFPTQVEVEEAVDERPPQADATKRKGRRSTLNFDPPEEDDELASDEWRPDIRLTFHGNHVHAGFRELVELGVIDGEKMPGWMTGEEGVSIGAVCNGRIRGHKGSGL